MAENYRLEDVELSIDKYLEDYLVQGYAEYKFDLITGKGPTVVIKTVSLQDQLDVESEMKQLGDKEIPIYTMHMYQLKYLSRSLVSFADQKFNDSGEAAAFLSKKGLALLDKLLKIQTSFENTLKAQFNSDNIENFSTTPSTDTKPSSK